jgi:hypothetical protein
MGYLDFYTEFGRTGAGLDYSEVTPGSDIRNLIGMLIQVCLNCDLIAL